MFIRLAQVPPRTRVVQYVQDLEHTEPRDCIRVIYYRYMYYEYSYVDLKMRMN